VRAVRVRDFGDPGVLRLEEVPDPEPGPGEVLVRVEAAGVNPVEAYVRAGAYRDLPALPYTPGSDAGGVVEVTGAGVGASLAPGTRVYTTGSLTGSYAELTVCRTDQVHALPQSIGAAQGAALGVPYVTAYRALFQRGRAVAGETVLVHGASGGVGLATVQFALAARLTVVATAGSDEGRELLRGQGVSRVVDHHDPAHVDAAVALTDGRGFDLIIELLANVNLPGELRALAVGGRVVVVGSRGRVEIDPRDLMDREADVRAMRLPNASAEDRSAAYAAIDAGLIDGSLQPVVGRELPLAEAPRAHRELLAGPAHGKIVLVT
jgi:NADPH:quinone reductase